MLTLSHQRGLTIATWGLWLCTAGVGAWLVAAEFNSGEADEPTDAPIVSAQKKAGATPGIVQFAPLWEQRLAPVAAASGTAAKSTAAPQFGEHVRLQGIVLEPGRDRAIFSDRAGNIDVRGVEGELRLAPPGMTVKSITADQVVIELQGKQETLWLKLPAHK